MAEAIGIAVVEILLLAVFITLFTRRYQHRITQLEDDNRILRKENANLHHQSARAEKFKRKVLQLTDEVIGLRRALDQATIHQPPPTVGE